MVENGKQLHQNWVAWKKKKVWCIGYARQYLAGSAETRMVVIKVHPETLYEVCEHEISVWVEPDHYAHRTNAMDRLNEIRNIVQDALNKNNTHHQKTVEADLQNVLSICNQGLGLSRPVAGDEGVDRGSYDG